MIVITLTNCPPALRGDLTKWLQEINTGVYVGRVSTRVREKVWKRVRDSTKSGSATMVFSTNNEQRMDFRVHNTSWEPIDFDGLKLILRPSPARIKKLSEVRMGFSKAARMRKAKQMSRGKRQGKPLPATYVVLNMETTGLSAKEDNLLKIDAILVGRGQIKKEFHALVKPHANIPPHTKAPIGLSNEILGREGRELAQVMPEFLTFTGDLPVVSHNADFDYGFLRSACECCGLPLFFNQCIDILALARRLVEDVKDYKLETLLEHFNIDVSNMQDCLAPKQLYEKLIELHQGRE